MRRPFFFQMIANGTTLGSGDPRSLAAATERILGEWYLTAAVDHGLSGPRHRVDLRFKSVAGKLKAAIVSKIRGIEIPLASCEFDGSTLRFQLKAGGGRTQAGMPIMVMTPNGGQFEGYWRNPAGEKIGPPLKLVRAAR